MLSWLLAPFIAVVSAILAGAHSLLAATGLAPDAGLTWALSICLLVIAVRVVLLPLVVRQVRFSHAGAKAHPELDRIRRRYAGRTDRASLLKQAEELREAQRSHGLGAAAWLPLVFQLPVMSALYFVLRDLAAGSPVASITASLAQSAVQAQFAGVSLDLTLRAAALSPAGAVLVGLALALAAVTYLTQRYLALRNLPAHALTGQMGQIQSLMPGLSTVGVLISAAFVPAGVLLYWAVSAVWTLAQQAVVVRFWPTPTSPAAT